MIKYHSMSWFNREDTKAVNSSNTHRRKGRINHVIIRVIANKEGIKHFLKCEGQIILQTCEILSCHVKLLPWLLLNSIMPDCS